MPSYSTEHTSNNSKRATRIYKDLDLDFQINSATKDIQKLTDVESVKRSVRNLIKLNHYEKPFRPEIGSNLRAMLFENMTPQMNALISRQIEQLIQNYEPRCRLVQLNVQPDVDRNGYRASISFFVVNHPERVEVETFLERLR